MNSAFSGLSIISPTVSTPRARQNAPIAFMNARPRIEPMVFSIAAPSIFTTSTAIAPR